MAIYDRFFEADFLARGIGNSDLAVLSWDSFFIYWLVLTFNNNGKKDRTARYV